MEGEVSKQNVNFLLVSHYFPCSNKWDTILLTDNDVRRKCNVMIISRFMTTDTGGGPARYRAVSCNKGFLSTDLLT